MVIVADSVKPLGEIRRSSKKAQAEETNLILPPQGAASFRYNCKFNDNL
jgi:hypothetical protein